MGGYLGRMHPSKVVRDRVRRLTDLPNVGPATAADLEGLGIRSPDDLRGRDPRRLFEELCRRTGTRQDPCVLDVLVSVVRFVEGGDPRPWWEFSAERKG